MVVPSAVVDTSIQIPVETIVFSHNDNPVSDFKFEHADVDVAEQLYVLAILWLGVGIPAQYTE